MSFGGTVRSGVYADQFALENGIWKIWSLGIDQFYLNMDTWNVGWAVPPTINSTNSSIPNSLQGLIPSLLLTKYPPDLLLTDMGGGREDGFLGGTGTVVKWPEIHKMRWSYRNLVSGRTPDGFWEGCVPCRKETTCSLGSNGWQEPPTGP
jgi:hypothetical protein